VCSSAEYPKDVWLGVFAASRHCIDRLNDGAVLQASTPLRIRLNRLQLSSPLGDPPAVPGRQ